MSVEQGKMRAMLTRDAIERHSVDMRQFIDYRQSTLANGMRIVEVYNSSGLTFSILPDRGLDIWTAHYNGIPLTWISAGSPHAPDFGRAWLQQFNGGLLATCGLLHVGPPEIDPATGEKRDLHGQYSRLRAGLLCVQGAWEGDQYQMTLTATVTQARLFGEQMQLTRTYKIILGHPALYISDTISNLGDMPAPLMVLYHINPGFPVTAQGSQLYIAHEAVYPRDKAAQAGIDTWATYDPPVPEYAEQVFYHHPRADENRQSMAAILRDEFGLLVQWDTTHLPYFIQWKNTRQGIYVNGIEPGNCFPEGQNAARLNGRLSQLDPGQSISTSLCLEVIDGGTEIEKCRARIERIRNDGKPTLPSTVFDAF